MIPSFDSDIRGSLAGSVGRALGAAVGAETIRLPSRASDASLRPPRGTDPCAALSADFGSLWGAPLVETVRAVNGWLLFGFTPAFYDALVSQVNASLPLPEEDGGVYAVNRMLALARHTGGGCPNLTAARRALLLAVSAHRSPAAYQRALRAAETLFSSVPPRDRPALLSRSGALGGALARLLFFSR
jgi:hypothetical protein